MIPLFCLMLTPSKHGRAMHVDVILHPEPIGVKNLGKGCLTNPTPDPSLRYVRNDGVNQAQVKQYLHGLSLQRASVTQSGSDPL